MRDVPDPLQTHINACRAMGVDLTAQSIKKMKSEKDPDIYLNIYKKALDGLTDYDSARWPVKIKSIVEMKAEYALSLINPDSENYFAKRSLIYNETSPLHAASQKPSLEKKELDDLKQQIYKEANQETVDLIALFNDQSGDFGKEIDAIVARYDILPHNPPTSA